MVVLDPFDLLDDNSGVQAPGRSTQTSSNAPASASSSGWSRGDVVLAKYGNTSRFYWAKVKKVYKNSRGVALCDVEWLRPQAGTPAGKLYALRDGHDETCHGDALPVADSIRPPSADDLRGSVPPGAGSKAAASVSNTYAKAMDVSDLLGDPVVEPIINQSFQRSSCGHTAAFAPSGIEDLLGAMQSKTLPSSSVQVQGASVGNGCQSHGWQADFSSMPSLPLVSAPQVNSGFQSMPMQSKPMQHMPVGFGSMQSRQPPQHFNSNAQPLNSNLSINNMQASIASNLSSSWGRKEDSFNSKIAQNQEPCFDFISEMMSGALTNATKGD